MPDSDSLETRITRLEDLAAMIVAQIDIQSKAIESQAKVIRSITGLLNELKKGSFPMTAFEIIEALLDEIEKCGPSGLMSTKLMLLASLLKEELGEGEEVTE